jgi:predicted acylesterase/phospholipase RssA
MLLLLVLVGVASAGTGIGWGFSGAGGRIAQHAALMSALLNGTCPNCKPMRPDFLAGASSGALSAVMLSAVVETQEKGLGSAGVSFEDYKKFLFNVQNSDIYNANPLSIASNIGNGFILDNTPFQITINKWLTKMGYFTLGSLYIPTCISVVERDTGFTYRLWSDDPRYAHLDLLEVLMASTALPIAFSPRQITGFPNQYFIDGGTGIDTLPFTPLLERPEVSTVYGLVYNSALTSGGSGLPTPLNSILLLANALAVVNDFRVDLYIAAIEVAKNSNKTSFLYDPVLPQDYSTLDFKDEKLEFVQTLNYTNFFGPTQI